jgi:hypothetical protein
MAGAMRIRNRVLNHKTRADLIKVVSYDAPH